ncbi:MAG: DUF1015 domain-containing protein [Deltaproteobacteria bacterium]|nr:DUF1015 domain-containing protein [Candidatus Zymogenaceae bacterium]
MADIKPFRAFRYNERLLSAAERVTTPPYDVISDRDQEYYYDQSPHNVIRLILGKKFPDDTEVQNQYTRAREFLDMWINEGILVREESNCLYGYTQTFVTDTGVTLTRRGFVGLMKLTNWDTGTIFPHERTFSKHKTDRLNLMREVRGQLSTVFALYADTERKTVDLVDTVVSSTKLAKFTDAKGVEHRLTRCDDTEVISSLTDLLVDLPVFIADGHHRYETALMYRDEMDEKGASGDAHRYIMINFTPMEDSGVYVLAPHRVISTPAGFDESAFLGRAGEHFKIEEYTIQGSDLDEFMTSMERSGKGHFGYYSGGDTAYLLSIRDTDSIMKLMPDDMHEVVKSLDVSVLREAIIGKIMNVSLGEISYTRELDEALGMLRSGNRVVFFINPTTIEEVRDVSMEGQLMPQKSTFFYPKVCSGLLFNLIRE